jgi:hypothetical protein
MRRCATTAEPTRKSRFLRLATVAVSLGSFLAVPLVAAAPAVAAPVPFACTSPTDFAVPNGTQLVAMPEGAATATTVGSAATVAYNALAYDPADHFLYALAVTNGSLVRIDSSGTTALLAVISGLPAPSRLYGYSSGTFDDQGRYWVLSNDPAATTAYGIDIPTRSVVATRTLTSAFSATDWTFADGYLWGLDGNSLMRVELGSGTGAPVTTIPVPGSSSTTYNAAWTFADGTLGFLRSDANQVLRITLNAYLAYGSSSTLDLTDATAYATSNDGASCTPGIAVTMTADTGTIHVPYTGQLTAAGGTEPYAWSLADGGLPDGLAIDPGTGAIGGTPTAAGTFAFTVSVTDGAGKTAQHAETIRILPGPFSCASPTAFVAPTDSTGASQLVALTEGPTPSATALGDPNPLGYNALGYDRADGYLYAIGIANAATHQTGNHLLRIDSGGNVTDLGTVRGLPPTSVDAVYPSGAFDDAGTLWIFNQNNTTVAYGIDVATVAVIRTLTLDAPFGANDWTFDLGYLWGVSGGVAYQADLTTGHVASETFSTSVTGDVNAIWTNVDTSLGFVFSASTANRVYRVPVQPGPLTADSVGTITSAVPSPTTALAANQNDGAACLPALQLSTAPGTAAGTYGSAYSGAVQATGGTAPYTWSAAAGTLPPGIALAADGTLSGTPTAAGTYSFTARVSDSAADAQTASTPVTIVIAPAPLTVTASNASMTYGASVPAISATYSGFVGSDGTFSLSVLPTCGTTATTASDVGNYPTTCSGASAGNYAITYVAGVLTVGQAGQAIVLTSTPPSPAQVGNTYVPTATGGASGNPVTFGIDPSSTAGACSISGATVMFTGTGFCVIDADQAGNLDYSAAEQMHQQVSVGYRTSGFLAPVSNAPKVNTGKAGRTYPLKWQLQQANGQYVSSLDAVRSIAVRSTSCSAFIDDPTNAVTATATGGTSLRYDTSSNQYVFDWQTSAKGCYSVFVTVTGGQILTAFFNLS